MADFDYSDLLVMSPGAGYSRSKIVDWSYYDDPIDYSNNRFAGNSRKWGDASIETQKKSIDTIIQNSKAIGLSNHDIAIILSIARTESGFNPDAAAGTTSALGLGQFINNTARSYGLNTTNQMNIDAQASALINHYIDNKNLAEKRGQGEDYIYKYHHDGPTSDYGGLKISQNKIMPKVSVYEELLKNYSAEIYPTPVLEKYTAPFNSIKEGEIMIKEDYSIIKTIKNGIENLFNVVNKPKIEFLKNMDSLGNNQVTVQLKFDVQLSDGSISTKNIDLGDAQEFVKNQFGIEAANPTLRLSTDFLSDSQEATSFHLEEWSKKISDFSDRFTNPFKTIFNTTHVYWKDAALDFGQDIAEILFQHDFSFASKLRDFLHQQYQGQSFWHVQRRDPIIIDLNGDGINTVASKNGVYFDETASGIQNKSGWVKATDGLLAWDRNENGSIDDGFELFGIGSWKTLNNKNPFEYQIALLEEKLGTAQAQLANYLNPDYYMPLNSDRLRLIREIQHDIPNIQKQLDSYTTMNNQGVCTLGRLKE